MHTTYRSSILPLFAFVFTLLALCYSACNDSVAEEKSKGSASQLKEEVKKFELTLNELKTIHANHVKMYSDEMGCTKDSKALEIINHHNELLNKYEKRLLYHKMQLTQSDTSNTERNNTQMLELKKDLSELNTDATEIRTGFDNMEPSHITK